MSSSEAGLPPEEVFLPGNARVVMGSGENGPAEMTVHEIEGTKTQTLDAKTELEFWARVRAKAQAKAREILAQAMAEADAIREQARQEGLAQGLAQAGQARKDEMAVMGGKLAGLMAGLEAERPRLWASHRAEFAELLKLAVEKTLHVELSERRREVLAALIGQSVEILDTRHGFTVVVNPADEAPARELLEQAKAAHPNLGGWRVKTDPAMTPGGVRLESGAGMVDNTLDSRFQQISELLERVSFDEAQG